MSWYSSTSVFVIRQGNKGGFLVAVKGMFHFLKDWNGQKWDDFYQEYVNT